MPQEESKRGAHFAKGSAPQTPAPEAASFDNEIRNAWSAAADPGETAVYLRAAGAGTALPRTVLSSARPDETAVFFGRRSIERQCDADRLRGSSCAASR